MKTTVNFRIRIFNPDILSFINDTMIRQKLVSYYKKKYTILKTKTQKQLKEEVLYNLYAPEPIRPEDVTIRWVDEKSGDIYTFDLTDKMKSFQEGRKVVYHPSFHAHYPMTCKIIIESHSNDVPIRRSVVLGYNPIKKIWKELFCFHENIILN